MASKKTAFWVIGGLAIVGVAAYILVFRKKTLANTGPSLSLATPPAGGIAGTVSPSQGGGGGNSAVPKTQLYLSANATSIRSSPHVNNGLLGTWFTNQVGSATGTGSYLGTVLGTTVDDNGDINPATGKLYTWYNVNLNPAIVVESSDAYYVREDSVTLK